MNNIRLIAIITICSLASFGGYGQSGRYAIELRDAQVVDAIRLLVALEGTNVIVPDDIEGNVTASFPSINLKSALNAIMESKGLGLIKKNNVVMVASKDSIEALGNDLKTKTIRLSYSKAKDIKEQLSPHSSKRGSIVVDERTNSITIRDAQQNQESIQALLKNIDRPDRQVLIEARIVEASSDYAQSLGVEWGLNFKSNLASIDRSKPSMPNGFAIGIRPHSALSLDIALTAAEKNGELKIISRPSIVTMNNQAATIRSGFKFYVRAPGNLNIGTEGGGGESGSSGGNLQEISAGISMVVTPQITGDDKISLAIDVAESQPDFSKAIEGIPTIADNSANTNVSLRDGEITVIGGLFQAQDATSGGGLPFFRDIPIVGPLLFGTQSKGKLKKELLIFIKPSIVKNNEGNKKILESGNFEVGADLKNFSKPVSRLAEDESKNTAPRAQPRLMPSI